MMNTPSILGSATLAAMFFVGTANAQVLVNEEFKLLPVEGEPITDFGASVAVFESFAIVGDPEGWLNGEHVGAAYLYDINTGAQLARLTADDATDGYLFGSAVDLNGSVAIIGSQWDFTGANLTGSAYIYDINTGTQLTKLLANDPSTGKRMGVSVAISGNMAIAGAFGDEANGYQAGAAYLFNISTGTQVAKLLAPDGASNDRFGLSVGISGNNAIVGASFDRDNGNASGSAYIFDVTTGEQLFKLLPDDGAPFDRFGISVAISGTNAIVGAYKDRDNGDRSGSAYLFDATTGNQIAKLLPDDGQAEDLFGFTVDISGQFAIVSAYAAGSGQGRVYLFDSSTGMQIAKLEASDGQVSDLLGWSVSIHDQLVLAGAPGDDDDGLDTGSAYLFELTCLQTDLNHDGVHDFFDIQNFLSAFAAEETVADWNSDGVFDFFDVQAFLEAFSESCI
jgi:WD40 repeat protein